MTNNSTDQEVADALEYAARWEESRATRSPHDCLSPGESCSITLAAAYQSQRAKIAALTAENEGLRGALKNIIEPSDISGGAASYALKVNLIAHAALSHPSIPSNQKGESK
jgi:hypothetical protein